MRRIIASLLILAAIAMGLAACGGKNGGSSSGNASESQTASQEIVIKASNWEFDKPEYVVPKDTPVKITLELEGGHGINIKEAGINLGPGKESTVVTLKEGTYEFKCSIMCGRGHSSMISKLTVK